MGVNILFFELADVPKTKEGFLNWIKEVTKWEEDHNYNDPKELQKI